MTVQRRWEAAMLCVSTLAALPLHVHRAPAAIKLELYDIARLQLVELQVQHHGGTREGERAAAVVANSAEFQAWVDPRDDTRRHGLTRDGIRPFTNPLFPS